MTLQTAAHPRVTPAPAPSAEDLGPCLARNLAALAATSPDAARQIAAAPRRPGLSFLAAEDGALSASLTDDSGVTRSLASRRRPLDEAARLGATVDPESAAVVVVSGFALGHHVQAIAQRLSRSGREGGGLVIIFEPDVALLRSVLERIDHSSWLGAGNIRLLTDPDDTTAMGAALRGFEGLVSMGVQLIEHPASLARLGPASALLHQRFTAVVETVKMTVVTTLVQVRVTFRNLIQNIDRYADSAGIRELSALCTGRPAVVVSAGPSLERNIRLLARPGMRDRVVIVAVQTVLKTLLARGIRPHFVTALDYSEISRRFYEGLTEADVRGIALVADPKVSPAVVEAWPGRLLFTADRTLDLLLGPRMSRERGTLRLGATVAHLAYFLARHLGCDPVALVGQDLGFTDNQYYGSGAAIHTVWSSELNEFRTLESLEWERIARMGAHLRRAKDALGRPIFTDEQMQTYLQQFEQEFRADALLGMRTLDATEGGVAKSGAPPITLADFLAAHAPDQAAPTITQQIDTALARAPAAAPDHSPLRRALAERLRTVRTQVRRIAQVGRDTGALLAEIREHQQDFPLVDRLISRIESLRDEITALDPGYILVHTLAQVSALNRVRADRAIALRQGITELEEQALRIERDIGNVHSLAQAADQLGDLLDDGIATVNGGSRISRDLVQNTTGPAHPAVPRDRAVALVDAVIPVDLRRGGLGTLRPLEGPFAGSPSLLAHTVARASRIPGLRRVLLASAEPDTLRRLLAGSAFDVPVQIVPAPSASWQARSLAIAAARLWARTCWRGGIANITCADEVFEPDLLAAVMRSSGSDAALLIGPDWPLLDPALCGQILQRFVEDPAKYRLVFSQAPPGLCAWLLSRSLVEQVAGAADRHGLWATIGGMIAYNPAAPVTDLIAQPLCIPVPPALRDCGLRFIADSPAQRAWLDQLCTLGARTDSAQLHALAPAPPDVPEHLIIRLAAGFAQPGSSRWICDAVTTLCAHRPDAALTLDARTIPAAQFTQVARLIDHANRAGIAGVHVRLTAAGPSPAAALACGAHVISMHLDAHDPGSSADREWLRGALDIRRAASAALPGMELRTPWIVPRMTRTDAACASIEPFVASSLTDWACCSIDPAEAPRPGERIAPLQLPGPYRHRLARTTLTITGGDPAIDLITLWQRSLNSTPEAGPP